MATLVTICEVRWAHAEQIQELADEWVGADRDALLELARLIRIGASKDALKVMKPLAA